MFEVTFTRKNDVSDGSAPESVLISSHNAATAGGAQKKAEVLWEGAGGFLPDRKVWSVVVKDLNTDD